MDTIKEWTFYIVALALCLLIVSAPIVGLSYLECMGETQDIQLESRYLVIGGCQVKENNQWIPLDNWRYLGD